MFRHVLLICSLCNLLPQRQGEKQTKQHGGKKAHLGKKSAKDCDTKATGNCCLFKFISSNLANLCLKLYILISSGQTYGMLARFSLCILDARDTMKVCTVKTLILRNVQ